MSDTDLTALQLAALMDIVTLARSRQSRTAKALRQDALALGLKPSDVDAALAFWRDELHRRYQDARDLAAAHAGPGGGGKTPPQPVARDQPFGPR